MADPKDNAAVSGGTKPVPAAPAPQTPPKPPVAENRNDEADEEAISRDLENGENEKSEQE